MLSLCHNASDMASTMLSSSDIDLDSSSVVEIDPECYLLSHFTLFLDHVPRTTSFGRLNS